MSTGAPAITIVGNLTSDPELRFTPSGAAVANFTVASTARSFDKNRSEWVDGDTTFIRCSVWREMAENVAESLTKGTRVVVTGTLKIRQYETDSGKGTSVECDVQEVGPSLWRASAKITRNSSNQQGSSQTPRGGVSSKKQQADPWASSSGEPVPF